MPSATVFEPLERCAFLAALLLFLTTAPRTAFAQIPLGAPHRPKTTIPSASGFYTLEADQQRIAGKMYYAQGDVDVQFEDVRLRADHVEYNGETEVATARGQVQLDYLTQHLEASDARYEVRTGRGTFHHVRATFALQRRSNPILLISPNPLYFQAEEAERLDDHTYRIRRAWMTVCDPHHPTWKFYAPEATVELQKTVQLEGGNFRFLSVPVLYLPYATFPAEKRRDSGFEIPDIGESSVKGFILGDSVYWAPTDWMDASLGATLFSKRGWSETGDVRIRPWEDAKLDASYFGVIDRGLEQSNGPPIQQGGHEDHLLFTSPLPDGWRAVADLDQLTSLTFRLAWLDTYAQAVNSEVRNTAFLTNNFGGYSLDVAALSYRNFLNASAQTYITLRTAPEARFSSVDQPLFGRLPLYFSFDAFTGAEHRAETVTPFETPGFVKRSELAPSVTLPLHWGSWLDVTPSFTFRTTYYGGQIENGAFVASGFFRTTNEVSVDIRPPALDKVWGSGEAKWKHVIEPDITYNYVTGVNDFGRFVRFDEDETLTDTNEVEYGITQRLYRRSGSGDAEEIVSWKITQKYFFDPTFGGALVPGQRNVFQALDSITPFAFADARRNFSPIVSDLRITPGKRYDTQVRVDFDPKRRQLTAIGTLLKLKPYKESFLTLAHFSTINLPMQPLQPPQAFLQVPSDFQVRSNQVRALIGYGDLNRRGWNATIGAGYDVTKQVFQTQVAQIAYNGSCCGMGFEYRKLSFGTIRNENQYRVVFLIANLGSFGNLRRQEKVF
jgi:LPS-assembly protein